MRIKTSVMRKILLILAILVAWATDAFSQTNTVAAKADNYSRQMVVVTTEDWGRVAGFLQRFEGQNDETPWLAVGSPIPVVVGRNGLGWGRGLHPSATDEPQKKEGDGKSPAGIFSLSSAFGFAPPEQMKFLRLSYLQVTDALECVDDVQSARYNTITDNTHILNADWKSSEKMLEVGEQYRLGMVVDHNMAPRAAGKGSCIFIHIWKGNGSGTSGCTAMAKEQLEKIMAWLDSGAQPVLVQLPKMEYQRLQTEWKLPANISADK